MKKMLTILLVALMAVMSLGVTATAESNELRVWVPPFGTEETLDKEFWDRMFDTFEAEHGCTVEVAVISWDNYPEKYMAGITSGDGPDVGYMYADMFPDFIGMGAVMDMAPYITDADREIYPYVAEGHILGAQYALPFILGNPRIIYYNPAILAEEGIELTDEPITWDEFVEIGKKVTKDTDGDGAIDQWALTMGWGEKSYGVLQAIFTPFLLQAGGQLYAEDGLTATFGSEAGIKAGQFIYDLAYTYEIMPKDVTGMASADCTAMFNSGKTAFLLASSSDAASIEIENWGWMPCLKETESATMMVADQLVLMSSCRNVDLAMELIRHMLSADVQAAFHAELSAFPPINLEEPYNDNPAFEKLYSEYAPMLKTEKPVRSAFKINDYLYKNMQLVMMDEMSAEDALVEAQDYANTVIQGLE